MDEFGNAGMLKNDARLIILIPALNEADNIQAVIQGLKQRIRAEIVVIDDCSTDQTVRLAREAGATVLPLAVRLGAWGAIRTGIRYAQQHG
ncbi:MAG: glycosyltransferase, partial [Desulfatirhabdiaceae bacterium]